MERLAFRQGSSAIAEAGLWRVVEPSLVPDEGASVTGWTFNGLIKVHVSEAS